MRRWGCRSLHWDGIASLGPGPPYWDRGRPARKDVAKTTSLPRRPPCQDDLLATTADGGWANDSSCSLGFARFECRRVVGVAERSYCQRPCGRDARGPSGRSQCAVPVGGPSGRPSEELEFVVYFECSKPGAAEWPIAWFCAQAGLHRIVLNV
jgi:hypothetical protein